MDAGVASFLTRFGGAIAIVVLFAGDASSEVYFGDPHAHSTFSDPDNVGDATPEDFFRVTRDVLGMDFAALSDHDAFLTADEWAITQATTASFDLPGRFVAFPAVEWTHRWHMNVYFEHDDATICDSPDVKCPEADEFYAFYGSRIESGEAAAHVNHPIGLFPVDWRGIDDTRTTNVEVFNVASSSGTGSEEFGFGGVLWALQAGYRVGFVGVSDDHHTDDPVPLIGNGLTGCHADALERHELIAAFRARRCYATTGERILVDTEVGGVAMGGEVDASLGERLPVGVRVTGTAGPVRIDLVQGGDVVQRARCEAPECGLAGEVRVRDPNDFVYARIRQGADERAWSSPVWIRGRCAAGGLCLSRRLAAGSDGPDDCLSEWLLPDRAVGWSGGSSSPHLECRDGDPRCDLDDEPGQCTVAFGVCFGGVAAPRNGCAAGEIDAWTVVTPEAEAERGTPDYEIRRTLESIHHAAHTSEDKSSCSPLSRFRVGIGRHRLEVEAGSGQRTDRDTLTIDCRETGRSRRRLAVRPAGS